MRIEVSEIGKILDDLSNERMVIIGQPKGVGLTTTLVQYFVKRVFFDEDFSVLILVNNPRTKNQIAELFEDFLNSAYDLKVKFNYNDNIIRVYNNVVAIVCYTTNDLAVFDNVKRDFKFQYSFIEKDEDDEILNYYLTDYLPFCSKTILIATYDTDSSVFYMPDSENILKIIVYSELSKKNIMLLAKTSEYTLQQERITKGIFQ